MDDKNEFDGGLFWNGSGWEIRVPVSRAQAIAFLHLAREYDVRSGDDAGRVVGDLVRGDADRLLERQMFLQNIDDARAIRAEWGTRSAGIQDVLIRVEQAGAAATVGFGGE